MNEDDGLTIAYKDGQVRTTEFTLQCDNDGRPNLVINVTGNYGTNYSADFWCANLF
jgi:hypothetical protein